MAFRKKLKGNWNIEKKASTHSPCFCFLGYIYAIFQFFFILNFFPECERKYEIFVNLKIFLAHFVR
jgi:hypothetical protein